MLIIPKEPIIAEEKFYKATYGSISPSNNQ